MNRRGHSDGAIADHPVQRCGGEVHAGCPCEAEEAGDDSPALGRPAIQRACPSTRPAGEEAKSKTAGLLTPDVRFDRSANKVFVADFPVSGVTPPSGVTTEPDWERAMSVIAGAPSVGPTVEPRLLGLSWIREPQQAVAAGTSRFRSRPATPGASDQSVVGFW